MKERAFSGLKFLTFSSILLNSFLSRVVDVGDQGINDARWMSDSPTLVTGSGNGR